ncbi:hypothetical protein WJX75_000696 [Coccomyxa subellipsoidea]|uniref:Glycoside hydrolase family 5 domain-containing protein n=1 Tax=Coccomyxa subellipsoidea TaxID=248742 RepID=A0ABR2Z1R4_9CHLO
MCSPAKNNRAQACRLCACAGMERKLQLFCLILLTATVQVSATVPLHTLDATHVRSRFSSLPNSFQDSSVPDLDSGDVLAVHGGNRRQLLQNLLSSLAGALLGTTPSTSVQTKTPTPSIFGSNYATPSFFAPSPPPPAMAKAQAPPTPSYTYQQPPSSPTYHEPPPPPSFHTPPPPPNSNSQPTASNKEAPPMGVPPPPPYQSLQSNGNGPPPPPYSRTAPPPPPSMSTPGAVAASATPPPPPVSNPKTLASIIAAPPPPVADCGAGSSNPLKKCPATSATGASAGSLGTTNSASGNQNLQSNNVAGKVLPPPPPPQQNQAVQKSSVAAGSTQLNTGALGNWESASKGDPPPPPIPKTLTSTNNGVTVTNPNQAGGVPVQGANPGAAGSGINSGGSKVVSTGGGNSAGTGSSANLQASAVCGGSSGQKCVAGIVPADLSFLKPVASAPVPQNLQNSAGSTQPSTSSNSASNVNPLQKGTATSASLPGLYQQAKPNPLAVRQMDFQVPNPNPQQIPTTGTQPAMNGNSGQIIPSSGSSSAGSGGIGTGTSAATAVSGSGTANSATTGSGTGIGDFATMVTQLIPLLQQIPTYIQSIEQLFPGGGASGGGGGAAAGAAGGGASAIGGGGAAVASAGASASDGGAAGSAPSDQVVGAGAQPAGAASSGAQPAGSGSAASAQPADGSGAASAQPADGSNAASAQPADGSGAASAQPAGASAGGAAQPAGSASGGGTQPADASAGGAAQPAGSAAGGTAQPADASAGGAQPLSAVGAQPVGSDPSTSTAQGVQGGGAAQPAGGAQQPQDPGAMSLPGPASGAGQPANASNALQPAGAAGATSASGTAQGGVASLSARKVQVQSLLQLGPGPDTPMREGTGGGPGLISGSYGASSAMPLPMTANQSSQQPKQRLYVLPNCLYMIRAGDTCGSSGPSCGLGWDKSSQCGPQQVAGGCCQPGFSCRQDDDGQIKCLPSPAPSYNFSDPTCDPIAYRAPCGKTGDCCPDGWTCQVQMGLSASCQPARSSLIPPSSESLILDYQSPRAMPGYYPGEDGQPPMQQQPISVPQGLSSGIGQAASTNSTAPQAASTGRRRLYQTPATAATTIPATASIAASSATPATPATAATSAPADPATASNSATPNAAAPTNGSAVLPITGIGALNLPQYSGIWGGKWCQSDFDPPSLDNVTKPPCPSVEGAPLPDIHPVFLPPIASLSNGSIFTASGPNGTLQAIALKAFNWGGFDDGSTFLSGLYGNRSVDVGDMATVVYRAQLLGFNAVRLPFRFSDLNLPPKNWSFTCATLTYGQVKMGVSNPMTNDSSMQIPRERVFPAYGAAASGFCNVYIPNVSTLSRFLWVIEYLVGAGMYVIPAYHPADYSVDNTVVSTPNIFLRNWAHLWSSISELPVYNITLQGRIMLDLISEPDIFGLQWTAVANRNGFQYPAIQDLYGPTMQALLTIDDGAFFVLEGTGQAGSFPGMAWGSGFVTDTATLQQYNISDPIPFFENLMGLPELYTRIVFSPHVYGPNVTGWANGTQGQGLWDMMQLGFNWLTTTGYTSKNGTGPMRFPIIVGELGSTLDSEQELDFFRDYQLYATGMRAASRQLPTSLPSWSWYTTSSGSSTLPQMLNGSVIWPAISALTANANTSASSPNRLTSLGLVPWYLSKSTLPAAAQSASGGRRL